MRNEIITAIEDDEDEVMALDLQRVAEAIGAAMGGSAEQYAMHQLGEGLFAMVFGDNPVVTSLEYYEADEPYPQDVNRANMFTAFTSRHYH